MTTSPRLYPVKRINYRIISSLILYLFILTVSQIYFPASVKAVEVSDQQSLTYRYSTSGLKVNLSVDGNFTPGSDITFSYSLDADDPNLSKVFADKQTKEGSDDFYWTAPGQNLIPNTKYELKNPINNIYLATSFAYKCGKSGYVDPYNATLTDPEFVIVMPIPGTIKNTFDINSLKNLGYVGDFAFNYKNIIKMGENPEFKIVLPKSDCNYFSYVSRSIVIIEASGRPSNRFNDFVPISFVYSVKNEKSPYIKRQFQIVKVKPGGECNNSQLKGEYEGKTYVCKKIENRLIWKESTKAPKNVKPEEELNSSDGKKKDCSPAENALYLNYRYQALIAGSNSDLVESDLRRLKSEYAEAILIYDNSDPRLLDLRDKISTTSSILDRIDNSVNQILKKGDSVLSKCNFVEFAKYTKFSKKTCSSQEVRAIKQVRLNYEKIQSKKNEFNSKLKVALSYLQNLPPGDPLRGRAFADSQKFQSYVALEVQKEGIVKQQFDWLNNSCRNSGITLR